MFERLMYFLFGGTPRQGISSSKTEVPYSHVIGSLIHHIDDFHREPLSHWERTLEEDRQALESKMLTFSNEKVDLLYSKYLEIAEEKIFYQHRHQLDTRFETDVAKRVSILIENIPIIHMLSDDSYVRNYLINKLRGFGKNYVNAYLKFNHAKLVNDHFLSLCLLINAYSKILGIDTLPYNKTGLTSNNFPRISFLNESSISNNQSSLLDIRAIEIEREFNNAKKQGKQNPAEVFEYTYMTETFNYALTAVPKGLSNALVFEVLLYLDLFFQFIYENPKIQSQIKKINQGVELITKSDIIDLFFDSPKIVDCRFQPQYLKVFISNLYYSRIPASDSTVFFEDGKFPVFPSALEYFRYGSLIKTTNTQLGGNYRDAIDKSDITLNNVKLASEHPNGFYKKISNPTFENLDRISSLFS